MDQPRYRVPYAQDEYLDPSQNLFAEDASQGPKVTVQNTPYILTAHSL
jgi:hypothetical protein